MQTGEQKTATPPIRSIGLVRRMEIAIRWQYRRKVFLSAVIKAIWGDLKMSVWAMLLGLLAPFVIVLTIPCRLGIWMLSPIFTPFVKMDVKHWLMMAEIIERKNPPNEKAEPPANGDSANQKSYE